MRNEIPSAALFKANRKKLRKLLKKDSIAVIRSNDIYPSNADASFPFKQNSDLFYLTGISQEDSVLLIFPDSKNDKAREILFLRETNPTIAIWEGAKLTKKQATDMSGVQRIEWVSNFDQIFNELALQAEIIFLSTNEHPRSSNSIETQNDRFIVACKKRFPLHNYGRLSPLLHKLRIIKSDEEIYFTQKACNITESGFRRILNFVKPGIGEWEVEAEFIHEFTKSGSRGFAYSPIIAGGANACILHYIENKCVLQDGDLLLLDVAAEYTGWNADMTRTIPVNGKFTPRQRDVYNAVLRILHYANSILRPGILIPDYHKLVLAEMENELIALGLFTTEQAAAQDESKPLVKKYFMHGTSHHLGIDVHDVSPPFEKVAVGMLFTIEPGIYIPEEKLGVRLENDYFIGKKKNFNLMKSIPIEADEIENLMK